ncbi:MAG: type IV secretory system conjugative DNA transfer family protein, partial [Alphaproteobacteria bacterium]|nr:type IV secretory system conjugative DNA transfer family protein [Alphaproteobacteria bacterium]
IIGQDIHQINERYGNDAAATIISTTAAKIILRQNDPESAKKFSEMMGKKITKKVEMKDGKEVETPKEEPIYSVMDIMKIETGKQLILYQGWYHRPIEAVQERHFENQTPIQKKLHEKVLMGESAPLPEFLVPSHHAIMGYEGTPKILDPMTKEVKILEPLH